MYDKSGTENLRANQTIKGPSTHDTPSMSGEDVGGKENLRAQHTVKTGPRRSTPGGSSDIPATTFRDGVV
jgi:hypothetical protein